MKITIQLNRKRRQVEGFSMVEIVIVLAIIALLAGGAIKGLGKIQDSARIQRVQTDLTHIASSLTTYQSNSLKFPNTEQGLRALVTKPTSAPVPRNWVSLAEEVPQDPWGEEYLYRCPGVHNPTKYDLASKGPDMIEGTADDIGNWKSSE